MTVRSQIYFFVKVVRLSCQNENRENYINFLQSQKEKKENQIYNKNALNKRSFLHTSKENNKIVPVVETVKVNVKNWK